MSLSISSSDSSRLTIDAASRFIKLFLITALFAGPFIWACLIVLDPFDTGRVSLLPKTGMFVTGPRVSNVSRLSDPAYNAVIVGNSTMQLLMPERLNQQTGLSFVQLSTPATGPNEQKAIVESIAHRRGVSMRVVVIGMDLTWCDADREKTTGVPFPFWLYSPDPLTYASGLFRMDSVEALPRRIGLLVGREKRAAADGYWNTEDDYVAVERRGPLPKNALEAYTPPIAKNGRLAADLGLKNTLAALPASTKVVLLHPPIFVPEIVPDKAYWPRVASCKAALAKVASERPNTAVLDRWDDSAINRDRKLFFDRNHYRMPMAVDVETDLARILQKFPAK